MWVGGEGSDRGACTGSMVTGQVFHREARLHRPGRCDVTAGSVVDDIGFVI